MSSTSGATAPTDFNRPLVEVHMAMEARARLLFSVWASESGCETPWERLEEPQRQGWFQVLRFFTDELSDQIEAELEEEEFGL